MAIISITYGNASLSKKITIEYDDVTHTIVSGTVLPGSIAPYEPRSAGYILYVQEGVGFIYRVRVQNTTPYAFVQTVETDCGVAINSATPSPASTNEASDGSIVVDAEGNGVLRYRIDELSAEYQVSNVFNGLAPGTYTIRVRNVNQHGFTSDTCYDTLEVTVGYADVVCGLALGTIEVIKANGGTDGEINVLTVIDPIGLELEYRLDAGAWQSSPSFTGLAADDYLVQVRYKDFTGCTDDREVELDNDVTCDARITGVTIIHESAKYTDDGRITVDASTSHSPVEYSIDDGDNYQSSNVFTELSPGTYIVRIKDDEGCEDVLEVEVFKFKSPYVEFPIAQSIRIVPQVGTFVNTNTNKQNFDNTLFKDMRFPGVEPGCYNQPFELEDTPPVQFRSNYNTNTIKVYDADDTLIATLNPLKKTSNLNYSDERAAHFADAGDNQVQVFFDTELPSFYEVGMDIVISGLMSMDGTYEIKDIRAGTGEALGYLVLVIDKVWPGGTLLSATVTTLYDVVPYEVYELSLILSIYGEGIFYLIIEGADVQFDNYSAQSEPLELKESWPEEETMVIDYKNTENGFNLLYTTGIINRIRVGGFLEAPKPGGERTVMEDSARRLKKLREYVSRNPTMMVFDLPPYILEKLPIIFAHDYFTVNEVEYQTEEDFEPEYFPNEALGNGKGKLRQVDFMAENTHDSGESDVDILVLEVEGTLLQIRP